MPSQYGAVGGYGGYGGYSTPMYGGYGGYSTPSYGMATPSYGMATPSYGTTGYGGMSMTAGNPLLEGMPMGYLGVGTADEPKKTTEKKTRSVTLKKKTGK